MVGAVMQQFHSNLGFGIWFLFHRRWRFTKLGLFYPTSDGRGLRRNSMSWIKASNLRFVESPAGVGWSYSNTSSDYNTGDAASGYLERILLNLCKMFGGGIIRQHQMACSCYSHSRCNCGKPSCDHKNFFYHVHPQD